MKVLALIGTLLFSLIAFSQDNSMPGMDSMPGMNMSGMGSMPQGSRPNTQVRSERAATPERPTTTPVQRREQSAPAETAPPRSAPISIIPDLPESTPATQNTTRRPVVTEKIGENTQKCDEPCVTCESTVKCQSTRSYDTSRETNERNQPSGNKSQSSAGATPQ